MGCEGGGREGHVPLLSTTENHAQKTEQTNGKKAARIYNFNYLYDICRVGFC